MKNWHSLTIILWAGVVDSFISLAYAIPFIANKRRLQQYFVRSYCHGITFVKLSLIFAPSVINLLAFGLGEMTAM